MHASVWTVWLALTAGGTLFAAVVCVALPRVLAWRGVWFCWHTKFGPALVFDSADEDGTTVRLLNVNGAFQSVCYVDEELLWDPACEYHRSWALAVHRAWPLLHDTARINTVCRRALVMGGGGYSFPKWLVAYRPDFSCEAVEIDPVIVSIARERFFVDELEKRFRTRENGRLVLAQGDAWEYLRADTKGYDLIVNDVFRGNRPLGPLSSAEGALTVRAHLAPGGRYIANVRCALEGRSARVLKDVATAFEEVFDHVEIIPERPEEPRKKGNNALLAWNEE